MVNHPHRSKTKTMDLEVEFMHAVTRYDRTQEKRKGYNPYALAQYMQRAAECVQSIKAGKPIAQAISEDFNDRLRDHLLKWFGLPL